MRKVILTLFFLLPGLFCSQLIAQSEPYLEAIQFASKEKYEQAIPRLRKLADSLDHNSDPALSLRTQTWLGLSLVAQDEAVDDAQTYLEPIICSSFETSVLESLFYFCDSPQPLINPSKYEYDMATAAIVALGSLAWRNGDYEIAARHYTLAIQRAMTEISTEDTLGVQLKHYQKQESQAQTGEDKLQNLTIQQSLAKEQLKQKILVGGLPTGDKNPLESNTGALQAYGAIAAKKIIAGNMMRQGCQIQNIMKSMEEKLNSAQFSEEQKAQIMKKLAPLASNEQDINCESGKVAKNTQKQQRTLARVAAREPKYFYSLASRSMCQYVNPPNVKTYADLNQHMQRAFAGMVEADRGSLLAGYEMTQPGVLSALNEFLDVSEQIRNEKESLLARAMDDGGGRFLKTLADCLNRLQLVSRFGESIRISLLREHHDREHIEAIVNTYIRMIDSDRSAHNGMMLAMAYHELGRFYLQKKLLDEAKHAFTKAVAELNKPGLFRHGLQTQVMGVAAINILRSQAQFVGKYGGDHATTMRTFTDIETAFYRAIGEEDRKSKLTQAEQQKEQQEQIKQGAVNELQNVQGMLGESELAGLLPSNMQNRMSEMIKGLQAGEHDSDVEKMMEKLSEGAASKGMTLRQNDALGSTLENTYARKNAQKVFELVATNLMLDMDKTADAERWFKKGGANKSWWHGRTRGFLAYTQARLHKKNNNLESAAESYSSAVKFWYSYPYTVLEQVGSPFNAADEMLQEASYNALQRGDHAKAFDYFELARHTNWDSPRLYGYLTGHQLDRLQKVIEQQFNTLVSQAEKRSKSSGDHAVFAASKKRAEQARLASHRGKLNPILPLYDSLDVLSSRLKQTDLLQLLESMDRFTKLHSINDLKQHRKHYIVKEAGESALPAAGKNLSSGLVHEVKNLKDVQAQLRNETLFLAAWTEDAKTHLFGVTRSDLLYHEAKTDRLIKLVKAVKTSEYNEAAKSLYEELIAPFSGINKQQLVITANGALQMVPFAALVNPETGAWLNDEFLLRQIPSASDYGEANRSEGLANNMLVVDASAVPGQRKLNSAPAEIAAIKKLFSTDYVGGDQATREAILNKFPRYSTIHFAGHSYLNPDFPDLSRLYLYDKPLYAMDIQQLDLSPVKLLVLNSCQSAANVEFSHNNEFSALHATFMNAGVDTIVATLNVVKDQVSAEFVSYFYARLKEGDTLDLAAQKTRKHLRESGYTNPSDWATFVLNGRGT